MNEQTKALGDILNDEAFWAEQRVAVMGQMVPLFIRMFQAGAAMGARRRPRTKDELDDIIEDENLDVDTEDVDAEEEEELGDIQAEVCKELGLKKPKKRGPKKGERTKLRKRSRR